MRFHHYGFKVDNLEESIAYKLSLLHDVQSQVFNVNLPSIKL